MLTSRKVLRIIVKTRQTRNLVEPIPAEKDTLSVRTKEVAREGRANRSVVELLAKHFGVPPTHVTIVRGLKSKTKLVEIEG